MRKTLPLGTRVKIRGIKDEDTDLNGLTGFVCSKNPFAKTLTRPENVFGEIGVMVKLPGNYEKANKTVIVNVMWTEIKEIQETQYAV